MWGSSLADQRVLLLQRARLDLAQHADGAQQVLVDRVVVIHRELHQTDDAAEVGDEAPEHARLVHPPERRLRRSARSEDFEEQPVRLRIGAQLGVDALQRLRDEPRRVGMDRQTRSVGDPIQPDEVDRIALERVGADDVDAVVSILKSTASSSARGRRRSRPRKRSNACVGLACRSSSAAQTIAVRSPTSLATRK